MKKILLFLAALSMASCSDSSNTSNNSNNDNNLLLATMVQTSGDGTQTTTTYRYSDSQLIEINASATNQKTIFTYVAGFPTEINTYRGSELTQKTVVGYSTTGQLSQTTVYRYALGDTADIHRSTFTFGASNVTVDYYKVTGTGTDTLLNSTVLTLLANGNIASSILDTNNGSVYTYDGNKSPLSSITAAQVLRLIVFGGGENNVLTTQKATDGAISSTYSTYTYNSSGYPVTENYTTATGEVIVREYTYN